ncbi:MAG: proline dehydrogenase family protein [Candidatus Obscuribacterales bacterium]|nr:proline dehydrogenase family protein [Candidatus Obscuribacterales bacterium]
MLVQEPALKEPEIKELPVVAPNPSIVDQIPLKLIMLLAAPYLAGKTAEAALRKAHQIYKEQRFCSTLDILGEDATVDEDCQQSVYNYVSLIDLVAKSPLSVTRPEQQITVSFKPSMFSTATPGSPAAQKHLDRAYERIETIVNHARQKQIRVTLEAEDHNWTDFHLDTYFALINAGYDNVGTVLQSRLFRTRNDIKRFDERMRVRMVIGIYNEPAQIAATQKPIMKELAVEYASDLCQRGTYVELASHDNDCVKNFLERVVVPQRIPANKFEVQHLLGVPRKDLQQSLISGQYFIEMAKTAKGKDYEHLAELARAGALMRMYLPYGTEQVAGPYCRRRLKANPNMFAYGIKNLLHIQ